VTAIIQSFTRDSSGYSATVDYFNANTDGGATIFICFNAIQHKVGESWVRVDAAPAAMCADEYRTLKPGESTRAIFPLLMLAVGDTVRVVPEFGPQNGSFPDALRPGDPSPTAVVTH